MGIFAASLSKKIETVCNHLFKSFLKISFTKKTDLLRFCRKNREKKKLHYNYLALKERTYV